jgi:ATP-binding cassette subfamily B protein
MHRVRALPPAPGRAGSRVTGSPMTAVPADLGTPRGLLWQMIRCSSGWVSLLVICGLANAFAVTLLPAVLGGAVDAMVGAGTASTGTPAGGAHQGGAGWAGLGLAGTRAGAPVAVVALAALAAIIVGCDALNQLASGTAAAESTSWLRRIVLGHVLLAGPRMAERFPAGDLVSRVIAGAADAGNAPAGAALAAAAVIPTAGSVIMLVLIDPVLAAVLVAGLPVLALILRRFVRDTSDVVASYQRAQGQIAARLVETLAGARTVAAAGTGAREVARILSPLAGLRAHGERTWRIQGRVGAQGALLVPLLQVLVLGVGGMELSSGRITPGELLAASQYAVMGAGAGAVMSHLGRLARARGGAGRLADVLGHTVPAYGSRPLPAGPGRVEFRDVTVRAGGGTVLDRVDLAVPGGTALAIVGRSGAGKSVLAALAARLAEPDGGTVLLDGVPVADLERSEFRRAVQCAFGRPALFGATVGDAICFGDTPPPWGQVLASARAACADSFIRRLPAGYRTPLAQAPLSGGEAQRLGLARAFAHAAGARVLVLDDATSSLDTVTEMQVSRALTAELAGLTRLIVAHRAGTAARADLVAWLDQGCLRACGRHEDLWADPGYRAVFATAGDPAGDGNGGPG